MKKLLLTTTILASLALTACGGTQNEGNTGSSASAGGKNYKTKLYTCSDKNLKGGCSESEKENIGIFKVSNELCSLASITDKDEIKLEDIVIDGDKAKLFHFEVDPKTKVVNIIVSEKKVNNTSSDYNPKNIDILFDLTYYSTDNKDLESEVINTRKKKLEEELLNNLQKGDKVTLRYIGTIDYGTYPEHKNAVLKDIDEFQLKGTDSAKVETKYYSLTLRCKDFKRTKTTKIYAHLENKKKEKFTNKEIKADNIASYDTKDELLQAVLSKINNKYNSGKYSYGTYFLETLSNYEDFLNRKDETKNDVNMIISDFKFQLHPIMKKNKNIPNDLNWSFPPEKLDMWKKGTKYYDFYTQTIPTYFSNRCQNGEKLELIGLETDDIERKNIMKDYYKNYLFKKCNVEFK